MTLNVLKPLIGTVLTALSTFVLTACENAPGVQAHIEAARARNDGPAIWRVRDEDSTLYLYGAVHFLPDGFDWQRDDLKKIMAEAGTVFFEVSQDEASLNRAQVIAARDGYYSGHKKLSDELDGYEQKLLLAATLNVGLEPGALERMQPWLAANMLANTELEAAGFRTDKGADKVLHAQAVRRGKYIQYLETMDEHLTGTATLPKYVQMQSLRQAMEAAGDLSAQTQQLNREWARGNVDYIEKNVVMPLEQSSPEYYEALFERRNQAWVKSFADFLDRGESVGAAIIGVGHMVGPDSLLIMLEAQGYQAERYFAYQGENVIKTIDLYK